MRKHEIDIDELEKKYRLELETMQKNHEHKMEIIRLEHENAIARQEKAAMNTAMSGAMGSVLEQICGGIADSPEIKEKFNQIAMDSLRKKRSGQ